MKQEQKNQDTHNIVPLGSDEIKSILKSQSESVFKDKNISNNSNFVNIIDVISNNITKIEIKISIFFIKN